MRSEFCSKKSKLVFVRAGELAKWIMHRGCTHKRTYLGPFLSYRRTRGGGGICELCFLLLSLFYIYYLKGVSNSSARFVGTGSNADENRLQKYRFFFIIRDPKMICRRFTRHSLTGNKSRFCSNPVVNYGLGGD